MIDLYQSSADFVPVANIEVGKRKRKIDPAKVNELAESIAEVGLLNPVILTGSWKTPGMTYDVDKQRFRLIAGAHRLAAVQQLGLTEIPATVLQDVEADDATLAEIDENLVRSELTPIERAEHLEARKRIYVKRHPETAQGVAGAAARWVEKDEMYNHDATAIMAVASDEAPQAPEQAPSYVADTAAKTGLSERTIRRDVQMVEDTPETVRDAIRERDPKATQAELLALSRLPEGGQLQIADWLEAGEVDSLQAGLARYLNGPDEDEAKPEETQETEMSPAPAEKAKPTDNASDCEDELVLELPDFEAFDLFAEEIDNFFGIFLDAESTKLIVSEPPNDTDLLEAIARYGERVLVPGGVLFVRLWNGNLPEALWRMSQHLRFHWLLGSDIRELYMDRLGLSSDWEPWAMFMKGELPDELRGQHELFPDWLGGVLPDELRGQHELFPDWLGGVDCGATPADRIIQHWTAPGDVVVDPCVLKLGGPVHWAVARGRYAIGNCDSDASIGTHREELEHVLAERLARETAEADAEGEE